MCFLFKKGFKHFGITFEKESEMLGIRECLQAKPANELGIVCSVWLNPGAATDENLDHKALFEIHRKAMAQAIRKAMRDEPSID